MQTSRREPRYARVEEPRALRNIPPMGLHRDFRWKHLNGPLEDVSRVNGQKIKGHARSVSSCGRHASYQEGDEVWL